VPVLHSARPTHPTITKQSSPHYAEALGWTVQRPRRRAAERDQAAIDHWVKTDWPRIKKTPGGAAR
jgi:hypothetical protein